VCLCVGCVCFLGFTTIRVNDADSLLAATEERTQRLEAFRSRQEGVNELRLQQASEADARQQAFEAGLKVAVKRTEAVADLYADVFTQVERVSSRNTAALSPSPSASPSPRMAAAAAAAAAAADPKGDRHTTATTPSAAPTVAEGGGGGGDERQILSSGEEEQALMLTTLPLAESSPLLLGGGVSYGKEHRHHRHGEAQQDVGDPAAGAQKIDARTAGTRLHSDVADDDEGGGRDLGPGHPSVVWTAETEPGEYITFPERYAARLTAAYFKRERTVELRSTPRPQPLDPPADAGRETEFARQWGGWWAAYGSAPICVDLCAMRMEEIYPTSAQMQLQGSNRQTTKGWIIFGSWGGVLVKPLDDEIIAKFASGSAIVSATEQQQQQQAAGAVRKTASFFEFSLCLSRACLGKIIVFIYKWRKKAVFRRGGRGSRSSSSRVRCCSARCLRS
jgi:hypothetical protein